MRVAVIEIFSDVYFHLDCNACKCNEENKCIIGNYERPLENQYGLEENCSMKTIWILSPYQDDLITTIDKEDDMSSDKEIEPGNIRCDSSQIF